MDAFEVKDLSFFYPEQTNKALDGLTFSVERGQFVTVTGASGSGKTTLLRLLKTVLSPHGGLSGEILFEGKPLQEVCQREQNAKIGFVLQSPENQIVTDKVWHELAFGLESLGCDTPTIRGRVAEMASFFGIESWFYKNTTELSGGQKQLLNLASIMTMQPSVLILDEPTSQLDPIAAREFLEAVGRINRELGMTVIMTEHRLEEVFPLCDRVLVMDRGKIICDGSPREVGKKLKDAGHAMFLAMPAPMRIFAAVPNEQQCPVTVRDGREWLQKFAETHALVWHDEHQASSNAETRDVIVTPPVITLSDVSFRYEKAMPDVVKGLSLTVAKGELLAILGGNGTGKTTALSLIAGLNKPYRGKISVTGTVGALPQNPQTLFVKKTVREDLAEILGKRNDDYNKKIDHVSRLCRLDGLLYRHPYDLSGGEQQRVALAKILLLEPQILLLDEPTKGMDAEFKMLFAQILQTLIRSGVTVVMVSHDIEFCAEYAHHCALFFDGCIVTSAPPREFFGGNNFYTTSSNRMARRLLPESVTAEDVILACGGEVPPPPKLPQEDNAELPVFTTAVSRWGKISVDRKVMRRLSKRTIVAVVMIFFAIPLTIYCGVHYFGDRKYYFVSLLILLETMLPFFLVFEGRKPQAREIVVISVLCALGVAGRAAFFMLPQFKPVIAIVIISGVAFGGETGFLVGAVTMLVSNIMFGQGPWTPWQMFGMGIIGLLAGVLFQKGVLGRSRFALSVFGTLSAIVIYGGIMNAANVVMYQSNPTCGMFLVSYATGFPFDLIQAIATVIFLWLVSRPMLEKLDRIKLKYGFAE